MTIASPAVLPPPIHPRSIAGAWQKAFNANLPVVRPAETRSFREYVTAVNPRYRWWRHCEIRAEALQAVADGELLRLMDFEPPRHGKTELTTRHFPAYYLARFPDRWAGIVSYGALLAQTFSRNARDIYLRGGGLLRDDSKSVALWQTPDGGGVWADGLDGSLTGRGFHLGVIDDPLKNAEEAASEVIRAKHRDWYDATFYPRREPGAAIVMVMTRWNEADLAGHALLGEAQEAEGWHILNFPATAEAAPIRVPVSCTLEPDWRTTEGQALCPERYDEAALATIKARVGSYFWAAMYQQRPAPIEGGLIKRGWWKYYRRPEGETTAQLHQWVGQSDLVLQSWDMAFKGTETSDFVVGQVWAIRGADLYLLDQTRARMDFPETLMAVRALTSKWPMATLKLVEDAANGAAVIASLRRQIPGIVAVKPQGGKESRASAVTPYIESGNVYLPVPEAAPWVGDFVEECAAFDKGAFDDQVDAMSQALTRFGVMARAKAAGVVVGKIEDRHPGYTKDGERKRPRVTLDEGIDRWRMPGVRVPRFGREDE